MENNKINILGIPFTNISFDDMISRTIGHLIKKEKTFIVTANPEIVMFAKQNKEYKQIVESADYIVPDGFGILLASKMINQPITERVTGYDLTVRLLELCNENGWSVYLLGGKEEVNEAAANNVQKQYPGMKLAGRYHGYFSGEEDLIVKEIQEAQPDLILVALGFPRQEQWIAANKNFFEKGIFIGVGGSIDVLAGTVRRAPAIWRKLNLEWFYRLIKQPSRWRRMLVLPVFIMQVLHSIWEK